MGKSRWRETTSMNLRVLQFKLKCPTAEIHPYLGL